MLLKGKGGVVSELLSWDFGSAEQAYALVKLPDNSIAEWKVQDCLVVENRKTSEQAESPATDRQQLKRAIALLEQAERDRIDDSWLKDVRCFLIDATARV